MELGREVVVKVAELACLDLSEDEVDFYQSHLANILTYIEQIEKVEIRPNDEGHFSKASVERRDELSQRQQVNFDDVVKAAPDMAGSSFRVPRIIE